MKNRLLLFILFLIFTASSLIAQNTVITAKQDYCFTETVEIKTEFVDTANYFLKWQFKDIKSDWNDVKNMPCTSTLIAKILTLNNFLAPDSFDIRCVYKNKLTLIDSISNNVKLNILPQVQAPQIISISQPICYNTAPSLLSLTTLALGGDGVFTYQWEQSDDNTIFTDISGETAQTYQAGLLTENMYYRVVATSTYGCGSATSVSSKVEVYQPLRVDDLTNQTICYNTQPVILTAVPHGGGDTYTYQWQESTNGTNFTDITSENKITYQPVLLTLDRYYRVMVVSSKGCSSVYSNGMKVTVFGELKSGSIGNNQTICYNTIPIILQQASLPTGGNGIYSYQWQVSTDDITFTNITGQTTIQYQATSLTSSRFYRMQVTTGASCGIVFTPSVKVTVLTDKVAPQISSITQPICYNTAPALLSVTTQAIGSDGNFTYQWQQSTNNTTFSDIIGQTGFTYQAGSLTQTTYYRVVATATYGCGSVLSSSSKVEVYAALTVDNLTNQTICYNTQPAILTAVPHGGGDTYTYQWQESTNGTNFTDITSENKITYQPVLLTLDRYFRVLVVSKKGCSSVYSNSIKVSVYGELKSGSIGNNETICYNTIPTKLQQASLPTGGNGTYSYQWQVSSDNISFSNISGQTTIQYQATSLISTRFYRLQVTTGNGCGIVFTPSVKVTVLPDKVAPQISSITQPICYNTVPGILSVTTQATGSDGDFTYQWQQSTNNTTFSDIIGQTGLTYQAGSLTEAMYYKVIATATYGCGSVNSTSSKIEVYAALTVENLTNQTICYNTQPTILTAVPHGGGDTYTYKWQESTNDTIFTDITNPNPNPITYQPTSLTLDRYYRVLVESTKGCSSVYSNSMKVTVYGELKSGSIIGEQEVCYKDDAQQISMNINPTGSNEIYSFQWQLSTNNFNWVDVAVETTKNYAPKHLLTTSYFRLKVNSLCGTVYTNSVRTLVNPLPVPVAILGDTCVCSNQYADYSINSTLNPLYKLEWSITGGEFLNPNIADVKDVSVKWDKTSQINKLTITQIVILTGCKLVQDFEIKKLTLQSPERKDIIRNNRSLYPV